MASALCAWGWSRWPLRCVAGGGLGSLCIVYLEMHGSVLVITQVTCFVSPALECFPRPYSQIYFQLHFLCASSPLFLYDNIKDGLASVAQMSSRNSGAWQCTIRLLAESVHDEASLRSLQMMPSCWATAWTERRSFSISLSVRTPVLSN